MLLAQNCKLPRAPYNRGNVMIMIFIKMLCHLHVVIESMVHQAHYIINFCLPESRPLI